MATDAEGTTALVEQIRTSCMQKGVRGLLGLAAVFRQMDSDFSQTVQFHEFADGLSDYGVQLSRADLRRLFDAFDTDRSGTVDFREFITALRPPLTACRRGVINEAFDKLDADKDGVLKVDDLKITYRKNAEQHPDFVSGRRTLEEILTIFLHHFDDPNNPDGMVTREEFLDYYSGVSVTVDDDSYFDLMMRKMWDLPQRGSSRLR